ncbi:hypothetical protein HAX54_033285, partial [Datura stramonium]|nr:hypothetical protein [Datura stramonium]
LVCHGMTWALSGNRQWASARQYRQWHTSMWQVSFVESNAGVKASIDEWKILIKAKHEESKEMALGKTEMGVAEVLARRTSSWLQVWVHKALARMATRAHVGRHMAQAVRQFPCVTVFGSIPCIVATSVGRPLFVNGLSQAGGLDCRMTGEMLRQKPLEGVESTPMTT